MASWKLMLKVVAIYICVHIINIVEYCISFIYMYSVCVCVCCMSHNLKEK